MPKDIAKLLSKLEPIKAPQNLKALIIEKICEKHVIIARRKLVFFGVSTFLSGIATAVAITYAIKGFASTGFYQYLSLIFTEGADLIQFWKDFVFTIFESIPYVGITLVLVSLFVLLIALRSTLKYAKVAFKN